MNSSIKHWKPRDWRFVGLVAVNLLAMGLFLDAELRRVEQAGSGWRRIDIQAVQRLIDKGDLRLREAEWFHPTEPGERPGSKR